MVYRVYLRTLPARQTDLRSDYSWRYSTSRQSTGPGSYEKLVCTYAGGHLDEELLLQGRTPRVVESKPTRSIQLDADIFDRWVPVPDSPSRSSLMADVFTGIEKSSFVTTAAGTKPPSRFASTVDQLVADYVASQEPSSGDEARVKAPSPRELGDPAILDPGGQRRNLARGKLDLKYEWTWNGPLLEIKIEAAATNRNADVFLVVEEEIVDEQRRHVSFRIPITTQPIYVPQSFLDEEARLADEANKFWRGLVAKYVEVAELSPEDPVAQLGRMSLVGVEQRIALAAMMREHAPDLLTTYLRTYGLPSDAASATDDGG